MLVGFDDAGYDSVVSDDDAGVDADDSDGDVGQRPLLVLVLLRLNLIDYSGLRTNLLFFYFRILIELIDLKSPLSSNNTPFFCCCFNSLKNMARSKDEFFKKYLQLFVKIKKSLYKIKCCTRNAF